MTNLLCPAVKHSLKFFFTASTGADFQLVGTGLVDGIQTGYCDSKNKIAETKQDWVKKMFENDPQHWEHYSQECFENQPNFFKATIYNLKQLLNQSGGMCYVVSPFIAELFCILVVE